MKTVAKWLMAIAIFSDASDAAAASLGSEPSVVFRNEVTNRFEAPPAALLNEMATPVSSADTFAAPTIDEFAALGLREESVLVRAGGVRLRLRGGLRSALLAEERDGKVVLSCEGAPAVVEIPNVTSASTAAVQP